MKDRMVTEGKYIALLLRHHPEYENLKMDHHGWCSTEELICALQKRYPGFDQQELDRIVAENNKQRYAYNEDHTKIRARQGHSISVDVDLKEAVPPAYLFHGTGEKYTASIDLEGLKPMKRLYVHLSKDIDTAENVGRRHGRPVIYRVDAGRMQRDGYAFYLSENGVWLTKAVPVSYLEKL